MKQEILMVKIHNAIKEGKSHYESTKGNWKINKARINYIQYVVGVNKGEVVCAYEPTKWFQVESGDEVGRSLFEGKAVCDKLLSEFQGAKETLSSKFGSGSAIAYASLSELE